MIGLHVPPRCNSPGIFPHSFDDIANVLIPRERTLSQPIDLGLVVPDVTPKITCPCAHLKSVTLFDLLSGLDIIWMHDQYAIGRFGIISASWALVC